VPQATDIILVQEMYIIICLLCILPKNNASWTGVFQDIKPKLELKNIKNIIVPCHSYNSSDCWSVWLSMTT